MDREEFREAFKMGMGGRMPDPTILGCDTQDEAMDALADTVANPVYDETHVYVAWLQPESAEFFGINARSKEHAEEILELRDIAGIRFTYVCELSDLLDMDPVAVVKEDD